MMRDNKKEYLIACIQLNTIFNIMPDDIRNKIPQEYREEIGRHKLEDYTYKYDYNKPLNEQPINDIAREVLVNIYREYLCEAEEKEEYDKNLEILMQDVQKSNNDKYNKIFKNSKLDKTNNYKEEKEDNFMIETTEEKWYKKIFLFFKKFLKK